MTIDQDGTITQNSIYEPFGKQIPLMDGTNSRLGFISKEKDIETSLGDFGVRKYDEEIGRFTSIDPLWEKYLGWSPYHYCGNNPIVAIDRGGDSIIYATPNENDATKSAEQKIYKSDIELLKMAVLVIKNFSAEGYKVITALENMKEVVTLSPGLINGKTNLGICINHIEKTGSKYKYVGSNITIDLALIIKNLLPVMKTLAEELSHAFDGKTNPKKFSENEDRDEKAKTEYEDKKNEKKAKTRADKIYKQIPDDKKF